MKRCAAASILFACCTLLAPTTSRASVSTYCVGTSVELLAAFNDAEFAPEGSTQDIRVRAGSISLFNTLEFAPPGDKDNKTFSLTGGWAPGCATRSLDPGNTLVDFASGNPDNRKLVLSGDNARYTLEGIHFYHSSEIRIDDHECPLLSSCPDTDAIVVRYNHFSNGKGFRLVANDARSVILRNNLFSRFTPGAALSLVALVYQNDELPPEIAFNTFADMSCTSSSQMLFHYYVQTSGGTLHHNIFDQAGCGSDLFLDGSTIGFFHGYTANLRNNSYRSQSGLAPAAASGNLINVDPGFANRAAGDYHLRTSGTPSPAINAGMTPAQLVGFGLTTPSQDLDGPSGGRLVGNNFDIGAFESPGAPPTEFVVSTVNDQGAGSLRDAIAQANASPGTQTIRFNIPGSCPRRIALASALPDIVDDVVIDAYTQPGAQQNTSLISNTAVLCVIVGPASGSLSYALRVADAAPAGTTLTLRGLAFNGSYSTAPLQLRGGTAHVIQGNAFGGVRPGGIDSLGDDNLSHLVVRGNAQSVLIGGPDNEDRNWFGASTLNAILLLDAGSNGHTVQNNHIGVDPGGAVSTTIGGTAISIADGANHKVYDNVITGAVSSGIGISGTGASGILVKGNYIGVNRYLDAIPSTSNGTGVFLFGGAHDNIIGSASGTARSNIIANNKTSGVRIDATAGKGNVVRPNAVYGNGTSGSGLAVDIAAPGPLPNDPGDPDSGANNGQNTPVLSQLVDNPGGTTRQLSGTLNSVAAQSYRVDIYLSPGCAGGNRGGDLVNRVSTLQVTTDGAGNAPISVQVNRSGGYYTAIATREATGDTSEISACLDAGLFEDGFD